MVQTWNRSGNSRSATFRRRLVARPLMALNWRAPPPSAPPRLTITAMRTPVAATRSAHWSRWRRSLQSQVGPWADAGRLSSREGQCNEAGNTRKSSVEVQTIATTCFNDDLQVVENGGQGRLQPALHTVLDPPLRDHPRPPTRPEIPSIRLKSNTDIGREFMDALLWRPGSRW